MIKLNLTWDQFHELRAQLDAINHAKNLNILEGEVKNTVVESEWTETTVEIRLNLE